MLMPFANVEVAEVEVDVITPTFSVPMDEEAVRAFDASQLRQLLFS